MTGPADDHRRAAAQRWVTPAAAAGFFRQWARDWQVLPTGSVSAWLVWLAMGFVVCTGASWLITIAARAMDAQGMREWDRDVLLALERGGVMRFSDAILLESPGNLSYLIPVTLLSFVLLARARRPVAAASVVLAYVLQRPLILLGWSVWDRARPRLIGEGIASPPLHSFPSGHAALSIAVYGFLAYLWARSSRSRLERTVILLLTGTWVLLISAARVRLGTHWPSDVIGGAVIGLLWLSAVVLALRAAERRGAR